MRLSLLAAPLLALLLAALWFSGAADAVAALATEAARSLTSGLAAGLAGVRRGDPGAFAALLAAGATYGVAHAAGPGHGKALLAAAAAGTGAGPLRLVTLALAGALAQAATAAAVVLGGVAGLGAVAAAARAEALGAQAGLVALGALGVWLVARSLQAWRRGRSHACHHDHHHAPPGAAGSLGLVAAIGVRPCTGAMLTLAVALGAGIPWAGLAAVLAMALGTASVTAAAALAALGAREATLVSAGAARLGPAATALQAVAGVLALAVAGAGLAG